MWRYFSLPPLFSLAGVWFSLLLVSPVRAAEHLRGRYIQLTGWDSHLRGGVPSPLSHSSFPSVSQQPGLTSCNRKTLGGHQKPPDVFGRASQNAPQEPGLWTQRNSCRLVLYRPSLSSLLSTISPSPKIRGLQVFQGLCFPSRRYRGEEITSGFTPFAASRLAAEELPGRRTSCCRSCCFPLGLRAGLSGVGGGGSRTGVAPASTPAAEPAAGEGRRTARAACARARLEHEPDLTARRRQKPPPPLPLP